MEKNWFVIQLGDIFDVAKNTVVAECETEEEANRVRGEERHKIYGFGIGIDIMGHMPTFIVAYRPPTTNKC